MPFEKERLERPGFRIVYPYKNIYPKIDETAFCAPGAKIIGDVSIGEHSSIWYNVVVRGDVESVTIGKYTNIQDNSTVHVAYDFHTVLGDYITIGHGAIIHGCEIAGNCLIGMGAVILNYAQIGENSIIAAGTLIPERKIIPPNSLVMGSPGKVVKEVTDEQIKQIRWSAEKYAHEAKIYLNENNI